MYVCVRQGGREGVRKRGSERMAGAGTMLGYVCHGRSARSVLPGRHPFPCAGALPRLLRPELNVKRRGLD